MRFFLAMLVTLTTAFSVFGGQKLVDKTVEEWFAIAADATAGIQRREFAAQRIIMLADSSASILIGELKNPDSGLRRQVAAKLLGEIAPPEAENALLQVAFGDEHFLAEAARGALARLYAKLSDADIYSLLTRGARERYEIPGGAKEGEEDWLALSLGLAKNRGGYKALVMRGLALKRAAKPETIPGPLQWQVWEGLLDGDADLRLASVEVIPEIGTPEATERLAALLYIENDAKVLIAALRAMAQMRPPAYGEAVERQAGNDNPRVAIEALAALFEMGYPLAMFPAGPGGRAVATYVMHPSTPVRRRAVELLSASKNPAALEYLEGALRDRVGANRALAAKGLGEMGLTAAVGSLTPLLHDGRPEVRLEAAVALSKLGVVGVAAGVLEDLTGGSGPFRAAAAEALGRIGDARAVHGLMAALLQQDGDGGDEVRFAVATALGHLKDERAGRVLYEVMNRPGDVVMSGFARAALAAVYGEDPGGDASVWSVWAAKHGVQ